MPEAVRRAVKHTWESTLGSTGSTRERAQELVDEVARRAEESARAVRGAGRGVRGVGQKPREAAAGVGDRVREAIGELRFASADDVERLRSEIERLGERLDEVERRLGDAGSRDD